MELDRALSLISNTGADMICWTDEDNIWYAQLFDDSEICGEGDDLEEALIDLGEILLEEGYIE